MEIMLLSDEMVRYEGNDNKQLAMLYVNKHMSGSQRITRVANKMIIVIISKLILVS